MHMTNTSNLPVEALETRISADVVALRIGGWLRRRRDDRGGMGLRRVYRAEAPCRVRVDIARLLSAPWGCLAACRAARRTWRWAVARSRSTTVRVHCGKGEIIEVVTAGSGGYGAPPERDAEATRREISG